MTQRPRRKSALVSLGQPTIGDPNARFEMGQAIIDQGPQYAVGKGIIEPPPQYTIGQPVMLGDNSADMLASPMAVPVGKPKPSALGAFDPKTAAPKVPQEMLDLVARINQADSGALVPGKGNLPYTALKPQIRKWLEENGLVKAGVDIDMSNLSPKARALLQQWKDPSFRN